MEFEAKKQHEIDEMKLNFFTHLSHDFRTPLSLIIAPLEEVLKTHLNPEKPDVPLNKNDAFQKVQKRHVQEKR